MKESEYTMLMAMIFVAPTMPPWFGVAGALVWLILSALARRKGN